MMMEMLEAGGIKCSYRVTKPMMGLRNYSGNFEGGVIPPEGGVAVKRLGGVIATLPEGDYYYIYMNRPISEIIASWRSVNREQPELAGQPERIAREKQRVETFLDGKKYISFNYNDIVKNPDVELKRLEEFLPYPFDVFKAKSVINIEQYVDRANGEQEVKVIPEPIPEPEPVVVKSAKRLEMEKLIANITEDRDLHYKMMNEHIKRIKTQFRE
jgi:hypothetical protein